MINKKIENHIKDCKKQLEGEKMLLKQEKNEVKLSNNAQALDTTKTSGISCGMEKAKSDEMSRDDGVITSGGMEDHLPKSQPSLADNIQRLINMYEIALTCKGTTGTEREIMEKFIFNLKQLNNPQAQKPVIRENLSSSDKVTKPVDTIIPTHPNNFMGGYKE